MEVEALLDEKKTIKEFIDLFSEDHDIESKRKEARETLGVNEESINWNEIDKKYKMLAKEHHPDKGVVRLNLRKLTTRIRF